MMTLSAFSFFICSFLFQLRNGESVACLVLSSPDDRHDPLVDRLVVQLFVFFCGSRLVLDLFPPKRYKTPQNCLDLTVKWLSNAFLEIFEESASFGLSTRFEESKLAELIEL